jgi:hypothetical protein
MCIDVNNRRTETIRKLKDKFTLNSNEINILLYNICHNMGVGIPVGIMTRQ